jgi:predicted Rossmann fold nucleotide-binding protein DprA/Smf involved in DNA uptake
MNREAAYWMVLSHELPAWSFSNKYGWKNDDKMNLIIRFFNEKMSISDFFRLSADDWKNDFHINEKQVADLTNAKHLLASYAILAENVQNNGIEIIPVISLFYSKILKENMKKSAPIIIYVKGNKQIMAEKSIAIVGSRDASDLAMKFTENIAKRASKEYKVVVSGFARGVDKQALDSSITYKGQSIIVLPQGIMTFDSGFKTYYRQIINGDVLVLSTFHPKAGWGKELAMARNPIIYGLAKEIYVAEAKPSINKQGKETKGGTWAGVIDGLRRERTIYVRQPDSSEKNDNLLLIRRGAIAVDNEGNIMNKHEIREGQVSYIPNKDGSNKDFPGRVREVLRKGELSAEDILKKLESEDLKWTTRKLAIELKQLDFIEINKVKKKNYYRLKEDGMKEPKLPFSYD